jgi:Pyruvate/2-oxoacid:ferredoxin oxidoreductase delta subunit
MRFFNAYVRGMCTEKVPDAEIESLAAAVAGQTVEVTLGVQGVQRGRERLPVGQAVATALARRNIRSLLAPKATAAQVAASLRTALTAPAREAEDALEDAGIEFNLRYSIFASPDAVVQIDGDALVIRNDQEPGIAIPRQALRETAGRYFCADSLARLVSLDVAQVRFSESAILPRALQLEPGALMEPDTAHERLHKGDWRSVYKPSFMKEFCITCARCFIHCPDNAIIHAMFDKESKDTTGILGIDYDRCTACGLCASVCPGGAPCRLS